MLNEDSNGCSCLEARIATSWAAGPTMVPTSGLRCRKGLFRTFSSLRELRLAPRSRPLSSEAVRRVPNLTKYIADKDVSDDVKKFYRYEVNNPFTSLNVENDVTTGRVTGDVLAGKRIAIKDNFMTRGARTTCSSRMLQGGLKRLQQRCLETDFVRQNSNLHTRPRASRRSLIRAPS